MGGSEPAYFLVQITGQIDYAVFPECDSLDCRYSFSYGADWAVISGAEEGVSQTSQQSFVDGISGRFVFNFPIDITFKSTNPFGWPRLSITCYGSDTWGNSILRGYGHLTLPTSAGTNQLRSGALFAPIPSSGLQQLAGWLSGRRPELADPTMGAGLPPNQFKITHQHIHTNKASKPHHPVTQMSTRGHIYTTFNTLHKHLKRLGYDTISRGLSTLSEYALKPDDGVIVVTRGQREIVGENVAAVEEERGVTSPSGPSSEQQNRPFSPPSITSEPSSPGAFGAGTSEKGLAPSRRLQAAVAAANAKGGDGAGASFMASGAYDNSVFDADSKQLETVAEIGEASDA